MAELNKADNVSNNKSYLSERQANREDFTKIITQSSAVNVPYIDMDSVSHRVTNFDIETMSDSVSNRDKETASASLTNRDIDTVLDNMPNHNANIILVSPSFISELPDEASCTGKCGQTQSFPCNCDIRCVVYKNCCEDISAVCPSTLIEAHGKFKHLLNLNIECRYDKLLITSCHSQINQTKNSNKIIAYFSSILHMQSLVYHPVTDLTTGLSYINSEIFQCNADNKSVPVLWNLVINLNTISLLQTFTREKICSQGQYEKCTFIESLTLNRGSLGFQCIKVADERPNARNGVNETNFFSYFSYVQCESSSEIYVNRINAEKASGKNFTHKCKPLKQIIKKSLPNRFQSVVTYSGHVINIIPIHKSDDNFWEHIQCDTSDATEGKKQCHVTCNSAFGFVKRGNSCHRLHFYYVALPSSPLLDELHTMVSVHHFVHCLLKNELLFDSLDEWLPGRELFAPITNTTFYTMTFLMYAMEDGIREDPKFTSLMRSLPLLMREFKSRSARLNLCKEISTTQRSKVNASRDRVELSDLYWLNTFTNEAVCFQKKPMLAFSKIGDNLKYNLTLPTLTCDTEGIVEDYFEFRSQLNTSWCLNVKNKYQISSSVNKTILCFLVIVVIRAFLTFSEIV